MLYAITSTGSLRRGTIRPRHPEGGQMTDEEWIVDLAERLEGEAESAARDAAKQAKKAKGSEKKELLADREGLRSIASKAKQFVREAERAKTQASPARQHATKAVRYHATKKKSPEQLDLEIAEALGEYELRPTAEARRQVQTLRRREDFPEILAISMRADGTNYQVKVPDLKNKLGYDLVDVLVHHSGLRSIKSASRSRITPDRASKIVTKYLQATR
jgi:sugar-specific transcriptional regulator TrmB